MKESNLVYQGANYQALTDSLLVAEKFEKKHRDVLKAIQNIAEGMRKNSHTPLFIETTYINEQNGQEYPKFVMGRDGFTLLAMGFTGKKAIKFKLDYIEAFNKMENLLKSDDYILQRSQEILSKRLEYLTQQNQTQAKQIEQQQKEIEQNKPKVLFADAVTASANCILIGELATILKQNGVEIGQNRLFKYLRENSYLCSHGERYNMPTQKALDLGLFEVKKTAINNPNGSVLVTSTTKVTGKGQVYFMDKFSKLFCHESK